jgi:hypothetical protein
MFHLDTAFAIELLVLTAGAALLGWTGYAHIHAKKLVRAIAYGVLVLTALTMLCTAYYGVKYTRMGYFSSPMGTQGGMTGHGMIQKGDRMMKDMMDGGGGMMHGNQQQDSSGPDHSHAH